MVFVKAQLLLGRLDLRQNAVATLETTHSVANIKNRLPRPDANLGSFGFLNNMPLAHLALWDSLLNR